MGAVTSCLLQAPPTADDLDSRPSASSAGPSTKSKPPPRLMPTLRLPSAKSLKGMDTCGSVSGRAGGGISKSRSQGQVDTGVRKRGKGVGTVEHSHSQPLLAGEASSKRERRRERRTSSMENLGCVSRDGGVDTCEPASTPVPVSKRGPERLSYRDLCRITGNFSECSRVTQGHVAHINRAVFNAEHAIVKVFVSCSLSEEEFLEAVRLQGDIQHSCIPRLLGFCVEDHHRALVLPWAPRGSLFDLLHGEGERVVLTWPQRMRIAVGAARALDYLHRILKPPQVHQAVKSSNVLVLSDYSAQLADMSLASSGPDQASRLLSKAILGTSFAITAPEYASEGKLTCEADVYSFGVIMLELLTGQKPLVKNEIRTLTQWASGLIQKKRVKEYLDTTLHGEVRSDLVQKFATLALKCLDFDPEHRPRMRDVVLQIQRLQSSHQGSAPL